MRLLGCVLVGGQSRRFGSDKALALLDGRPLIEHALAALAFCDALAVAGRDWPGATSLPDWPAPHLGPLGGLNAALRHAGLQGFSHVASLPVDCPMLPEGWLAQLGAGPAHAAGQPLIGVWPLALAGPLAAFVASGGRRVRDWTALVDARTVDLGPLLNLNHSDDLAGLKG